jgi:hypothetical protein
MLSTERTERYLTQRGGRRVVTAERLIKAERAEEWVAERLEALKKFGSVLPEWLQLQQEIRDRLIQLQKLTALGVTGGLDDSLAEVNRKVIRYNELVPNKGLQKEKLSKDTFAQHIHTWE